MTLARRGGLAAFALLAVLQAAAQVVPVPVQVQLPLFRRIWKLDRSFPTRDPIVVAVVYQKQFEQSRVVASQVLDWEDGDERIRWIPLAIDDAPNGGDTLSTVIADVFYVAPLRGADVGAIARIARARRIRTITGVPAYVEAGLAVAIDVRNDRPRIVINLPASKAEGSSFPAQLLELARLVR